jgi:hypothetical protein
VNIRLKIMQAEEEIAQEVEKLTGKSLQQV